LEGFFGWLAYESVKNSKKILSIQFSKKPTQTPEKNHLVSYIAFASPWVAKFKYETNSASIIFFPF